MRTPANPAARPRFAAAAAALAPSLVISLVFSLGLAACSNLPAGEIDVDAVHRANETNKPNDLNDYDAVDTLPDESEIAGLPFYSADDDQCGPAALAAVFAAAGVARTPAELRDAVFVPQRRGSLQNELLAASRRAGLLPYPLADGLRDVLAEVAAGHPVLVLQQNGWALPRWHYAVVVGYDRRARQVVLLAGDVPRRTLSFADFDRNWAKGGRWGFVAVAGGDLPATAAEAPLLTAAAALENVDAAAAGHAYAAALVRWPDSLVARIGLGNAAYRSQDLDAAVTAYRRATVDHPQSADAWNNLAQALHASGGDGRISDEALAAARRAVALGGPRQPLYARTLATIVGTH